MNDSNGGLRSLRIESLRNLKRLRLDTEASVILLTGSNGAGKTTLIEALYLLARGKTFRGSKAGPLCTFGEQKTLVKGVFAWTEQERLAVSFERDRSGSRRVFEPPNWLDSAEFRLPLQVKLVSENAQILLDGEPDLRRRFLDWNVFHVEHGFARVHKDFRRVLNQRNAALRAGSAYCDVWDAAFVQHAEALDVHRRAFIDAWRVAFIDVSSTFEFLTGCDICYQRGWPDHSTLDESIQEYRAREQERGFTLTGPSRADFYIERNSRRAGFSRGQTKAVVALMQLAAERVHARSGRAPAIFLLDDLDAELDAEMTSQLWSVFCSTASQVIATRVAAKPDLGALTTTDSFAMFHVEHGTIRGPL